MDTAPSTTITSFKLWLQNKNLTSSTVRNYVVDVNKYLNFSNSQNPYTEFVLEQYISSISSDPNRSRYLASLNQFCQFALDQKLIKSNPLKKILHPAKSHPVLNTENLISQYQQHLTHKNFSPNTIKNYINDIHQFINWAENKPAPVILSETKDLASKTSVNKNAIARFFTSFRMTKNNDSR